MTDQEKMDRLFQAALQANVSESKPLARAFPKQEPIPVPAQVPQSEPSIATIAAIATVAANAAIAAMPAMPAAPVVTEPLVLPMENAGLDIVASTELGILLDEQHARIKRRHRRETLLALATCLALIGGSYGWFVHSPARVEAFKQVIRDVRATGDLKGMLASYEKSLKKIATRSTQIDQSTMAMGVSANQDDAKDPNFDAEMKAMMGGKGKTMGERNRLLQQAFGKKIGNTDTPAVPVTKEVAKIAKEDSFEWK